MPEEDRDALSREQAHEMLAGVVAAVCAATRNAPEDVHAVVITLVYKGNDPSGMPMAYTELHTTTPEGRMTLDILEGVATAYRAGRMGGRP